MIECICIDDSGRPNDLPLSKWVKKGKKYTIIYVTLVLGQRQLAFELQEIDLDESCYPYQYFLASRFIINSDDMDRLSDLVLDSRDADIFVDNMVS